jgi:single-stranded-DNA-specific exonuclease
VLYTDGPLEPPDFCITTALMLREAGPWGRDFPEPLFEGEFSVLGARVVGGSHLKFDVVAPAGSAPLEAIAFNSAAAGGPALPGTARLAYRLDVNEFRGRRRLQLVVEDIGGAQ